MNYKEKQIEELAEKLKAICISKDCKCIKDCYYCTAKIVYNLGYRHIFNESDDEVEE